MSNRQVFGLLALIPVLPIVWFGGKAVADSGIENNRVSVAAKKDILKDGDIEGSMDTARKLLVALRENNWQWKQFDWNLMRVPDQDYDQDLHRQQPKMATWVHAGYSDAEYRDKVAFYSLLYTRSHLEVIPGIEGVNHFEGFYIVAWKDGRVEKVPVADVRLYPKSDYFITVFPGMDQYDASLPGLGDPHIEEKIAAYKLAQRSRANKK